MKNNKQLWLASSVGYSIVLIRQGYGFDQGKGTYKNRLVALAGLAQWIERQPAGTKRSQV